MLTMPRLAAGDLRALACAFLHRWRLSVSFLRYGMQGLFGCAPVPEPQNPGARWRVRRRKPRYHSSRVYVIAQMATRKLQGLRAPERASRRSRQSLRIRGIYLT